MYTLSACAASLKFYSAHARVHQKLTPSLTKFTHDKKNANYPKGHFVRLVPTVIQTVRDRNLAAAHGHACAHERRTLLGLPVTHL